MRFEETRPGLDVCHQRYVRAAKSGHCACASMRGNKGMRFAESGHGRIWAHVTGLEVCFILVRQRSLPLITLVPDCSTVASRAMTLDLRGWMVSDPRQYLLSSEVQSNKEINRHQNLSENAGICSVYLGELRETR